MKKSDLLREFELIARKQVVINRVQSSPINPVVAAIYKKISPIKNGITEQLVQALSNIKDLEYVVIGDGDEENLSPLEYLPALERLTISGKITNWQPLVKLQNLKNLHLDVKEYHGLLEVLPLLSQLSEINSYSKFPFQPFLINENLKKVEFCRCALIREGSGHSSFSLKLAPFSNENVEAIFTGFDTGKVHKISIETDCYNEALPGVLFSRVWPNCLAFSAKQAKFTESELQRLFAMPRLCVVNLNHVRLPQTVTFEVKSSLAQLNIECSEFCSIAISGDGAGLQKVSFKRNNLESCSLPKSMPQLGELDLSYNKLTALPMVSGVSFLRELNLKYNEFSSIEWNFSFPRYGVVDISHNRLKSVPQIPKDSSVERLDLKQNEIASISGIFDYKLIECVDLEFNKIDLTPSDVELVYAHTESAASGEIFEKLRTGASPKILGLHRALSIGIDVRNCIIERERRKIREQKEKRYNLVVGAVSLVVCAFMLQKILIRPSNNFSARAPLGGVDSEENAIQNSQDFLQRGKRFFHPKKLETSDKSSDSTSQDGQKSIEASSINYYLNGFPPFIDAVDRFEKSHIVVRVRSLLSTLTPNEIQHSYEFDVLYLEGRVRDWGREEKESCYIGAYFVTLETHRSEVHGAFTAPLGEISKIPVPKSADVANYPLDTIWPNLKSRVLISAHSVRNYLSFSEIQSPDFPHILPHFAIACGDRFDSLPPYIDASEKERAIFGIKNTALNFMQNYGIPGQRRELFARIFAESERLLLQKRF